MKNSSSAQDNFDFRIDALGTQWLLRFYGPKPTGKLLQKIARTAGQFEKSYSRFLGASVISKLNLEKSIKSPDPELLEMITFAKRMYKETKGIFNIQMGGVLEDMGYDSKLSFRSKSPRRLCKIGFGVQFRKNVLTILPGTKLDMGGFGKGWLIDKLAVLLQENGNRYFSINAGGDIYTTSNHSCPVEVILENPFDTTRSMGRIKLRSQALAASSPNRRRWQSPTDNKTYHHLLDKHGENSHTLAAVFALHSQAKVADAGATALSSANPGEIKKITKALNLQHLIIMPGGRYIRSPGFEFEPAG